jgi:8-oxo-dGTP diphosphatase
MARAPILAAGGIVLRQTKPPLIAVVRLRKGSEWVLPKGKLDDGETPRAAAEREVLEETGHDVCVHEFMGTLAYEAGGRPKIVHYWRMEARGQQSRDLMHDVRAVDWLPLEAAVARLSRVHEQEFLANVGPLALEAAALARRSGEQKAPAPARRRRHAVPKPAPAILPPPALLPDVPASVVELARAPLLKRDAIETESSPSSRMPAMDGSSGEAVPANPVSVDRVSDNPLAFRQSAVARERQSLPGNLMRRVKAWLRRAA